MEIFSAVLIVVGFVVIILYINKKLNELADKQKPSSELLEYLKTTNIRLDAQGKAFNERLDNAAKVIGGLQKNIGEMSEIGRGMRELQDFLKSQGVEEVKTAGEKFDPNFMEAVEKAEEERKGYKINGRLLRPAKVRIVK